MLMKRCADCGTEFQATTRRQIYCSKRCANRAHEARVRAFYRQWRELRETA
jgi:hypothetical protein